MKKGVLIVLNGVLVGAGIAYLATATGLTRPAAPKLTQVKFTGGYTPRSDYSSISERYLTLLKRHLTRYDYDEAKAGWRSVGADWPDTAETMIGLARLDSLHEQIKDVLVRKVLGDLIECGVWRGGATIFMRGALEAYGDKTRRVWVADSFEGLPKPNSKVYPADAGDEHWKVPVLAVGAEQVRNNFARYGLLDDRVAFLVGWFKDTLPKAPISQLSILRVDADMYEGTIQALQYLYPKLSSGGYVIIDDYGALEGCRRAVTDFRNSQAIAEPIRKIDWIGVYWQKH